MLADGYREGREQKIKKKHAPTGVRTRALHCPKNWETQIVPLDHRRCWQLMEVIVQSILPSSCAIFVLGTMGLCGLWTLKTILYKIYKTINNIRKISCLVIFRRCTFQPCDRSRTPRSRVLDIHASPALPIPLLERVCINPMHIIKVTGSLRDGFLAGAALVSMS